MRDGILWWSRDRHKSEVSGGADNLKNLKGFRDFFPEEMAQRIYRGMEERVIQIGTTMIIAHLEKLVEDGRVENREGKYVLDG